MKVGILTPDSSQPNLAAMRISAFHKVLGDEIVFNFPLDTADFTYASVLFRDTLTAAIKSARRLSDN